MFKQFDVCESRLLFSDFVARYLLNVVSKRSIEIGLGSPGAEEAPWADTGSESHWTARERRRRREEARPIRFMVAAV